VSNTAIGKLPEKFLDLKIRVLGYISPI